MISLIPSSSPLSRQYAAQQGISEEEALEKGMEEKSKEFAEADAKVYVPA